MVQLQATPNHLGLFFTLHHSLYALGGIGLVTNSLTCSCEARAACLKRLHSAHFAGSGGLLLSAKCCPYDDPPPELFEAVSAEELVGQYGMTPTSPDWLQH
jgi:hypothetical protein